MKILNLLNLQLGEELKLPPMVVGSQNQTNGNPYCPVRGIVQWCRPWAPPELTDHDVEELMAAIPEVLLAQDALKA